MKKILLSWPQALFCLTILFSFTATAQQTPSYKEMMEDNSYNFYEVVKAAEAHFDKNGRTKGSGFKPYERWKNENESKFAPSGNRSNIDYYKVSNAYKELAASKSLEMLKVILSLTEQKKYSTLKSLIFS